MKKFLIYFFVCLMLVSNVGFNVQAETQDVKNTNDNKIQENQSVPTHKVRFNLVEGENEIENLGNNIEIGVYSDAELKNKISVFTIDQKTGKSESIDLPNGTYYLPYFSLYKDDIGIRQYGLNYSVCYKFEVKENTDVVNYAINTSNITNESISENTVQGFDDRAAASGSVTWLWDTNGYGGSRTMWKVVRSNGLWGQHMYVTYEGKPYFCVQPNLGGVLPNDYVDGSHFSPTNISELKRYGLTEEDICDLIIAYDLIINKGFSGLGGHNAYAIMQNLVWEYCDTGQRLITAYSGDLSTNEWNGAGSFPTVSSIEEKTKEVKQAVADKKKLPSFASSGSASFSKDINGNILSVGSTYELAMDNNGVLDSYNIVNSDGLTITTSSNKLSVTVPSDFSKENATIKFSKAVGGNDSLYIYRPFKNGRELQNMANFNASTSREFTVNLTFALKGKAQVVKVSANPEISDGSDCYSLAGAEYGIYKNNSYIEGQEIDKLITDENGLSNIVELNAGTYYVKEIKAPAGYALDLNVHTLNIITNQITTLNVKDYPQSDPISVLLRKVDKDTGQPTSVGGAKLSDAQFTFKFYKGLYDVDPSTLGHSPARTWLMKTNENGMTSLNENLKVSGDDFYYTTSGDITLPIGTITVQETKAPEGYLIDNTIHIRKITTIGNLEFVDSYNEPIIKEQVIKGKIEVVKQDAQTGKQVRLAGFTFEVFNSKGEKVDTIITNNDGVAITKDLPYDTYTIKETKAIGDYLLDNNATLTTSITNDGQIAKVVMKNNRITGSLTIHKIDAENGNIAQGNATLVGAVYGLYAKDDISDPSNDKTIIHKKDKLVAELVIGKDLSASIDKLYLGNYYLKEIKAPDGYTLSNEVFNISINNIDNVTSVVSKTQNVSDDVIKSKIEVIKKDAQTGKQVRLAGFTFEVFNSKGEKVDTIITNNDGVATTKDLPYDSYTIKETKAVGDYLLDNNAVLSVTITEDGKVYQVEMNNKRIEGSLTIHKLDKDTGTVFQGEASLVGAIYGLYAKDDILDPSNDKTVIHKKDSLVKSLTIDSKLNASVNNLYLGNYYLKEIKAPIGYVLSDEKINITVDNVDNITEIVNVSQDVNDKVILGNLKIVKTKGESADSSEQTPEEGAEFMVILKKYVDQYGSIEEAWKNRNKFLVTEYDYLVTDVNGEALSEPLAYGEYVYKQVKGHPDYVMIKGEGLFTISENGKTYHKVLNNKPFKAYLNIKKYDETSNKLVTYSNAEFEIYKYKSDGSLELVKQFDGKNYVSIFKTNNDGVASTFEELTFGKYHIKEINSPDGYKLPKNGIDFEIKQADKNSYYVDKNGHTIIDIRVNNDRILGQIEVYKEGEVLTSVTKDKDNNLVFNYETKPLKGMVVNIIANENILNPDDGKIVYIKDSVVETLTTNENGKALSSKLPLGTYKVVEKVAPNGFVENASNTNVVTLSEGNKTQTLVLDTSTKFVNDRQKVELSITKKDKETNTLLSGAVFGLYAKEDITNHDGKIIVKANELIETVTTNNKGYANFKADLPLSKYEIREIKAPIGYTTNNEVINIDASYKGQDLAIIKLDSIFKNEITKIEVSKKDITSQDEIKGATLSVYPVNAKGEAILGECFETWVSDGTPHMIKGLEVGKTYILRETVTPYDQGYVTSKDIRFTIQDTGRVQKVTMYDDYTKVEISKTDITTGHSVKGAELSIIPLNFLGLPEVGATFTTWITEEDNPETKDIDESKHLVEYLPVGKYILRERLQGEAWDSGYVTANDVKFEVKDTGIIQKVEMKDDYTKVEITKVDKVTNVGIPNTTLSLIPLDDNGKPKLGETFATLLTDDKGQIYLEYVPVGKYILRETVANFDLGYVTTDDIIVEVKDTDTKQEFVMKDDHTYAEFAKVDEKGDFLPNAKLQIKEKDSGKVVESWISTTKAHKVEYLAVGTTYIFEEVEPLYGFKLAKPIEFMLKDTNELQVIKSMVNEYIVGNVSFLKEALEYDKFNKVQNGIYETLEPEFNKILLEGAKIEIRAAEDIVLGDNHVYHKKGELIDTLTSSIKGATLSKNLLVGKYYYQEIETNHGFIIDNQKHYFEIKNDETLNVQNIEATILNEHPIINIDFIKSFEKDIYMKQSRDIKDYFESVKFGIFANEDIVDINDVLGHKPSVNEDELDPNFTINETVVKEERTLITKDTLIYVSGLDKDGNLLIAKDLKLPEGSYYLKELETHQKYILDENHYVFNADYGKDANIGTINIKLKDVENKLINIPVEIFKRDKETNDVPQGGATFEGAVFEIINKATNEVLETVTTDETGYAKTKAYPLGTCLLIKEIKAPEGYELNDEVFEVIITNPKARIIDEEIDPNFTLDEELAKRPEYGKGANTLVVFDDVRRLDVTLAKVSNNKLKLNGAIFNVYKTDLEDKDNREKDVLIGTYISGGIYLKDDANAKVLLSKDESFETYKEYQTNKDGILILENLEDGTYYTKVYDKVTKHEVKVGSFTIIGVEYGNILRFEEIKAPKGYFIKKGQENMFVEVKNEEGINILNIDRVNSAIIIVDTGTFGTHELYITNNELCIIGTGLLVMIIGVFYCLLKKKY